jgi:hypothetical protein
MDRKAIGKKCWLIPDGYIPQLTENDSGNLNGYLSHECACVVNTGRKEARITLTLYFEDSPPKRMDGVVVPAERSLHLRMDFLELDSQPAIDRGVPYSLLVESSEPIVVQMSRLDTTQNNMAFLSTMAYPIDTES